MRRTILSLTAALALALTSACGNSGSPAAAPPATETSPGADNTAQVCAKFDQFTAAAMPRVTDAVQLYFSGMEKRDATTIRVTENKIRAELLGLASEAESLGRQSSNGETRAGFLDLAGELKAFGNLQFLYDLNSYEEALSALSLGSGTPACR